MRFNFISVLAHELKAPLNAIEGYLKILRRPTSAQSACTMIERSLVRLDGMRKLIFDLLDLTRIESGQKQRELRRAWTCARARPRGHRPLRAPRPSGASISHRRSRAAEPVEHGRPTAGEMEIILNNLVSNAVKYNRDGGSVDGRVWSARTARCTIQVADTGIGMTPEESAKLFNEFVRIKNEDTYKILGSGLGLSTVRKLAQLYGGDATVKSEKGKGSIFTVTLRDAAVTRTALPGSAGLGWSRHRASGARLTDSGAQRLTAPVAADRTDSAGYHSHCSGGAPAEGPGRSPCDAMAVDRVRESCGQDPDRGRRPGHGRGRALRAGAGGAHGRRAPRTSPTASRLGRRPSPTCSSSTS